MWKSIVKSQLDTISTTIRLSLNSENKSRPLKIERDKKLMSQDDNFMELSETFRMVIESGEYQVT